MSEVICSRMELKRVLHKSSHNWLFEVVTILCFESFCVTSLIDKYTYLYERFCATVYDSE